MAQKSSNNVKQRKTGVGSQKAEKLNNSKTSSDNVKKTDKKQSKTPARKVLNKNLLNGNQTQKSASGEKSKKRKNQELVNQMDSAKKNRRTIAHQQQRITSASRKSETCKRRPNKNQSDATQNQAAKVKQAYDFAIIPEGLNAIEKIDRVSKNCSDVVLLYF